MLNGTRRCILSIKVISREHVYAWCACGVHQTANRIVTIVGLLTAEGRARRDRRRRRSCPGRHTGAAIPGWEGDSRLRTYARTGTKPVCIYTLTHTRAPANVREYDVSVCVCV